MIRIGLIGYGYWGPNVARNLYNNPRVRLVAICDRQPERLKKAQEIFLNQIDYVADARVILDSDDIDAVAIAVETSEHYRLVKEALLSGKHVYVEKPFTESVTQAEELTEIATKLGLCIHVDHIMVHHPIIEKIKSLIQENELGDILYIDAMRMNLGQIKKDVSAMWDLAVHDLAIIDFLTDGKEPHYISAIGEKYYNPKESVCFLTMRYPGFISHVQSSWISPLKERKLIIAGTKKMIVYDDVLVSEKLKVYDKGVRVVSGDVLEYEDYVVETRDGDVWTPYIAQADALYRSIDHFVECIAVGEDSKTGPAQAIRIQKILETADMELN